MTVLADLSAALAEVVENVGASVVRVEGRRRGAASGVVWSADGLILTAHHVLEQDDDLQIGLSDGQRVSATLAGRDPTTDVALLRTEARGLQAARWAEGSSLRVGNLALALARPGQTTMATLGILSAVGHSWRTPAGGNVERYVQTDVVMYPGFSGGPLVSADGQFLGMNSSALLPGVSIALPAETLRRVVEALAAHGHVRRGYLGVGAQPARLPAGIAEQLGQEVGLLLVSIEPGSPADKGGLVLGDTIVAMDGQPVRHLDDLQAGLTGDHVGQPVALRLLRAGQLQEVKVVVGDREQAGRTG